ncbi:HdrD2' [Desulforapulum autotrophicum HRM2]|uniref:HdrD2 n=1 Tax=Desulforapulum autotrophicum (strain ATCC 43914 / DSM 3382 / VKM B-1955 / HRM2) TaxID=177437 RepID=C0QEN0_DESAH|nr:CoB--CoM heterodisulfide reductase iron-sulfur subunit B family protein [Desulforapulum autotrophicum]ACN15372.1 HdrD2' [Desulforapulum autotrophicum HRM2]
MNYTYYPGCSLSGSAMEYDVSTRALMACLGVSLTDINDWNCCGATAGEATSALLSLALGARNLALAEQTDPNSDILVPCSACYLNLKKAEIQRKEDAGIAQKLDTILAEEQLTLTNPPGVRHLLDVLVNDITTDTFYKKIIRPLNGLKIAPYYGCQCLRPYPVFDDPEAPVSMEGLVNACGAKVFKWDMGASCCGASNMSTKPGSARKLVQKILMAARGADAIVTVCPMCQLNLEGFQTKISHNAGIDLSISILYLPQLMGLALGLGESEVKLDKNLALTPEFKEKLSGLTLAVQH